MLCCHQLPTENTLDLLQLLPPLHLQQRIREENILTEVAPQHKGGAATSEEQSGMPGWLLHVIITEYQILVG